MEFNFILNFIDAVFLQMDFFGMREGPLGSDDPMIKGAILSMLAVAGFGIALNVINSGIRKKMVDQVKQRRITKEVRAWQKERMAAFRSKDQARIANANKKSAYMNKMNMEMMQMNIRPMMITIIPLMLIFYFVLPQLFSYTVALSPIPLNVIPGDWFELTSLAHDEEVKNGQGSRVVTVCDVETRYEEEVSEVYSHSTVVFYVDGKHYSLKFKK